MKTKIIALAVAAAALTGCVCSKSECCTKKGAPEGVIGNWGARLQYDSMSAGHFTFSRGEDGKVKAFVLLRWGSPEWCKDVKVDGNKFSLRHPYGWYVEGTCCGSRMFGRLANCDGNGKITSDFIKLEGWRNPEIVPAKTSDAKFDKPINLLEKGLDGWQAYGNGRFCWTFKDGVLSNRVGKNPDGSWMGGACNLISKRSDFYDFNLKYDVRVPKGANSGVYLRGRYEIQTVDSYGKDVNCHNMAAYYGRVTPSVAAEKPAGEWQHVDITLYKRHLTIKLNGKTIIDNVPVTGVTGGAMDAFEFVGGPLYIQGDHTDADYRNMYLSKAL